MQPEQILSPAEQTIAAAGRIRESLAGSSLPFSVARLYSQQTRLKEGQDGLRTWNKNEATERLVDAFRLADASLIEKAAGVADWHRGMKRAAELMEWLSYDQASYTDAPLRMLAAAAYQIAGYPARSNSLLRTVQPENRESVILASFLSADFPCLINDLTEFWASRGKSEGTDVTAQQMIVEQTTSALGIVGASMRWGDEPRLEPALEKLRAVSKFLLHSRDDYSWVLAKLCAQTAADYFQSSLRSCLGALADTLPKEGQSALERYIRQSYRSNKSIAWPSQIRGIEQLSTGTNFTLCTPTGSGKTTVAELAILRALFLNRTSVGMAPLALYLVPSRALAAEVEARLSQVLRRLGRDVTITVTGLYGGTDWGPTDTWLTMNDPTVLICTYEKSEALIRFVGASFLQRLALVVIDEAHSVNFSGDESSSISEENRNMRLESLGTRLFSLLNRERTQVIALSAVAHGTETALSAWISGSDGVAPVKTEYRSTRQLIGRLECGNQRFRIVYDLLDGSDLKLGISGSEAPYVPNPFPPCPPSSKFVGNEKRLRPYLFWAAAHLAAPDASGQQRSVLVSVAQAPGGYAEDLLALIERDWVNVKIPQFFTPPTETKNIDTWNRCLASCEDYFGVSSREYRLLARGVAVHHGKMPGLMARLLVQVIDAGIVHFVIATSTLTEGVNLPFDTILIPSLVRYNGPLPPQEFSNLAGRAGRPGRAVEGRTLVLLHDEGRGDWASIQSRKQYNEIIAELAQGPSTSSTSTPKSALAKLIEHVESSWRQVNKDGTLEDFTSWLEKTATIDKDYALVSDERVPEDLRSLDALDGVILPGIVEGEEWSQLMSGPISLEESLKQLWNHSYARFASTEQERLGRLFVARGTALAKNIYPDAAVRRRLYRTSLSPRKGNELLVSYPSVKVFIEAGEEYAEWTADERFSFITELVRLVSSVSPFQIPPLSKSSKSSPDDVLRWWLHPSGAKTSPSPTQVSTWHDFISKNFIYRFSWGLGSILSVALDESGQSGIPEATFDKLSEAGLPWIALWIKELMTWGTLEPVAAFILARGLTTTRKNAEELAQEYYQYRGAGTDPNDLLHPGRIAAWVDQTYGVNKSLQLEGMSPHKATLERDFSRQIIERWRVFPAVQGQDILWFDPAGYLLARSECAADSWKARNIETHDFLLDPKRKMVLNEPYL